MDEPEQRFGALVAAFAGCPEVTAPTGSGPSRFGSEALKVNGAIFAMLTRGQLVVKLPADRVRELIAAGTGGSFDAGKGRPMREWVAVVPDDQPTWHALANEALAFVGSRPPRR